MNITRSIFLRLYHLLLALLCATVIVGDTSAWLKILLVLELNIFAVPLGLFGVVSLPHSVWYVMAVSWIASISFTTHYNDVDDSNSDDMDREQLYEFAKRLNTSRGNRRP